MSSSRISNLPKYVVIRHGRWHVRRNFPTNERDAQNRIVYMQITRRCIPETEDQAARLALAIENAFEAELVERARPQTVDDFFEAFLAAKEGSVERRTHEYYASLFERYVKGSTLGSAVLEDIRLLGDVQQFYRELRAGGASADAIRKVHTFLSLAFNQAVAWGSISRNPVRGAVIPKASGEEISFFDQAKARQFLDVCRGDRYIILHFALETGMRPGEYLALRWSDVDIERGLVTVRQAVTVGLKGGGFVIKEPKTPGSRRTLVISNQLRDRLRVQRSVVDKFIAETERRYAEPLLLEHKKQRGANYQKRRVRRKVAVETLRNIAEYDLVFPAANGAPMSRLNLNKREMKKALKAAGLASGGHSLYSLRHTCATLMLAAGVDIKTIAEKLGHADATQVLRTYGHVLPSMRSDAMEKLSAALY